jgi:hypothetical protein
MAIPPKVLASRQIAPLQGPLFKVQSKHIGVAGKFRGEALAPAVRTYHHNVTAMLNEPVQNTRVDKLSNLEAARDGEQDAMRLGRFD